MEHVLGQLAVYSGQSRKMGTDSTFVCCPFHNERTPSFRIFHSTSSYNPGFGKCYGCGVSKSWDEFASLLNLQPFAGTKPTELYSRPMKLDFDDEDEEPEYTTTELPRNKKWRGIPTNLLIEIGCKMYRDQWSKYIFLPCNVGGEMRGYIRGRLRKEKDKPSYLNKAGPWSKKYGLFPFDYTISKMIDKTIVLVEGPRDSLRLLNNGIPAMSLLGTQSWTRKKAELLEVYGVERVLIMMDGDDAGGQAIDLVMPDLKKYMSVKVIDLRYLRGSPYYEYEKLKSKKEKKAFKGKLWDPGNIPQRYVDRIKAKYFEV